MITYQEFKTKWLGKGIDFDGSYGNQCMDVYRQYVKEVLGYPQSPGVTGAKDVWNTYLPTYFDRIANSPTGVPKQGDIVIWGMAPYGHIAICDSATTSTVTCFEQNWTELNGSGVTEIRKHTNYNNVLGWLKPKTQPQGETMTDEQKRILDFIGNRTEGDVREAFGALADKPNKDEQIRILQNSIKTLEAQLEAVNAKVAELEAKFVENQKNLDSCQSKLTTANSKIDKLNETISNITEEKNTWQTRYNNKNTEFNDVTEKFDNLSKLFEEYKKCYPQTTKPSIIEFIKSLFLKWTK